MFNYNDRFEDVNCMDKVLGKYCVVSDDSFLSIFTMWIQNPDTCTDLKSLVLGSSPQNSDRKVKLIEAVTEILTDLEGMLDTLKRDTIPYLNQNYVDKNKYGLEFSGKSARQIQKEIHFLRQFLTDIRLQDTNSKQ